MSVVDNGNLMRKLEAQRASGFIASFIFADMTLRIARKISLFLIFAFVKDLPINDMVAI